MSDDLYTSVPRDVHARQWVPVNGADSANIDVALERANRIVAWVNANGGEARYEPENHHHPHDPRPYTPARIMVRRQQGAPGTLIGSGGWAVVSPGWWVIRGSEWFPVPHDMDEPEPPDVLDHYPCDPNTFAKRWRAAS